jgi:gluconolactonase
VAALATVALAATAGALIAASPALAAAPCPGSTAGYKPIVTGQGSLESVIVDRHGRLFYTDSTNKALMRVDTPGAAPREIVANLESGGGLAFDGHGMLIVGFGDSVANGLAGSLGTYNAGLIKVDPDTGAVTPFITGTQMSNGVARTKDGAIFASNDIGTTIDRISPTGQINHMWASVQSSNGMAVDSSQRYLYVNQTFRPANIVRVEIAHPANAVTYATPDPSDIASGPDGMTIDKRDRLYVAANSGNQIWRVNRDRTICALASGLMNPSAVAIGHGATGFSDGNVYAVAFSGVVARVGHVRD